MHLIDLVASGIEIETCMLAIVLRLKHGALIVRKVINQDRPSIRLIP